MSYTIHLDNRQVLGSASDNRETRDSMNRMLFEESDALLGHLTELSRGIYMSYNFNIRT